MIRGNFAFGVVLRLWKNDTHKQVKSKKEKNKKNEFRRQKSE